MAAAVRCSKLVSGCSWISEAGFRSWPARSFGSDRVPGPDCALGRGGDFSDGYVYCFATPLVDHVDLVVGNLPVAAYLEAAFERRIVADSVRGGQGIGDDIYVQLHSGTVYAGYLQSVVRGLRGVFFGASRYCMYESGTLSCCIGTCSHDENVVPPPLCEIGRKKYLES